MYSTLNLHTYFKMTFPEFVKIATLAKLNSSGTNETPTNRDYFDGMERKLIEILASKLRFSYELVSPADREYGSLFGGNWSGMVGMVERGEADLIIHLLAMTEGRLSAIDFTFPYAVSRVTFATTNPERTTDKTSFLLPFSYEVWYCILLYVVLKIFTVVLLRNVKFCPSSGRLTKPRNVAGHLLASSYALADMFLRHSYAVVLLASLTFPRLTGVRTASELSTGVQRGTHQCATIRGSFIERYFQSSDDFNLRIFGESMSKYGGSFNAEEALEKSNSAAKVAFFSVDSYLLSLKREYFISGEALIYSVRGIGLKKGFCCKARLDSLISYIWASGIYDKITKDAIFEITLKNSKRHPSDESSRRSLSFGDLEGVFTLLYAGHALAVVVFILELAIFKYFTIITIK